MKLIDAITRRQTDGADEIGATEEQHGFSSPTPGLGLSQTTSLPNIFGGYDQYEQGTLVSSSRPNIFGGYDRTHFPINDAVLDAFGASEESVLADILNYVGNVAE